jgi:TolB-like protein/DNA-binding winged helix-turn-helix (wHTH) protein/Tfp pilus assembly protein PilF
MPPEENTVYEFQGHRFDPDQNVLFFGDERVDATPKSLAILKVLIENSGRVVSKEELMRRAWPDSFVEEANLSHHIFNLRKAIGEKLIETVPKRGYRFVGVVSKANSDSADARSANASRRSWLVIGSSLAAVVIVVVAGWFAISKRESATNPTPAESIRTIAVMPFVNESGGEDVDYLADGITETLISSLSQIRSLGVKPRATVFRYKGKDVSAATAGSELDVQAVLFGRITQRGDDLTIFLSLVDTQTEYQIWGKQYARKISDLASFQTEIGREVAHSLEARLSGADEQRLTKNYSKNAEAYRLYLLGRYYWNKFTGEGIAKAIESFEAAIKLDPTYALAYAGVSDSYCVLGVNGHIPRDDAALKVRAAAYRAVEIGNDVAAAHQAMGAYKMFFEWDLKGADTEFKRAIEIDPDFAGARELYSYSLIAQRRYEESLAEIKKASELEPTSLIIQSDLASVYRYMGQFDEALKIDRRTVEMDPNYAQSRFGTAHALSRLGDHDGAVREISKGIELSGGSTRMKSVLGIVQARAGNKEEAQKIIDGLVANSAKEHVTPEDIAMIYSVMGEKDRAFEWLERAYAERSCWLYELNVDPDWEPIRDDPRFHDLVKRIGL